MTDYILETKSLEKHFGGFLAIDKVNLQLAHGELRCLIGPNGAGKSTLFKLIMGVHKPNSGQTLFKGQDISKLHPFKRINKGLSIKFQVPGIFLELETQQNLRTALQSHLSEERVETELDRLLDLLNLANVADRLAGHLSHGQQQWLEIGMAIALHPDLLLLDEPTAGMTSEETHKSGELIQSLNAEGMTIMLVEHDMEFVRQIAKKITVLHYGRIFMEGSLSEVESSEDVAQIYLGKA
jgi:branched-chain amino acid transport system ATP-binding protein